MARPLAAAVRYGERSSDIFYIGSAPCLKNRRLSYLSWERARKQIGIWMCTLFPDTRDIWFFLSYIIILPTALIPLKEQREKPSYARNLIKNKESVLSPLEWQHAKDTHWRAYVVSSLPSQQATPWAARKPLIAIRFLAGIFLLFLIEPVLLGLKGKAWLSFL